MNRIDFEDDNYGLNLKRNGNGDYVSPKTRERFEGWNDGIKAYKIRRSWRIRSAIFKAAKGLFIAGVLAAVSAEVFVLAHFAVKYW